jgi:hypothetical protein
VITLTPRTRTVLALAALVTAAPTMAVTAAPATAAAGPGTWTPRVLPSTTAVSQPRFLFDNGQVVGVDVEAGQFTGQPWRWSAATGRRNLSLGGGTSASITDAAEPAGVVGTTQRLDPTGTTLLQTAVRWVGQGAVPLRPDVTDPTWSSATNRNGDAVVYTSSPATGIVAHLVPRTGTPEQLPLFAQLQTVSTMNDDRAMVVFSRGPGTIGPGSFSVLRDGQSFDLQLTGVRDFPSCVTAITQSGYVAGTRYLIGTTNRESVIWRDGVRTLLPGAPGLDAVVACTRHGVNEAGHVVGTQTPATPRPGEPVPTTPPRAVIWRDGVATVLATDTATRTVRPVAVNDGDVVLATVDDPTGASEPGPALFFPDGRRVDLRVPAGLTDVRALDVNECNQVMGTATRTTAGGTRTVTVVWRQTR